MPFEPRVNQELVIEGVTCCVAEHPAAPGMVYGQEGRRAIVYQLIAADGARQALKVFKPRFRVPRMVAAAERLEAHAGLPGLQACRRIVLTGSRHAALLREHRDLAYAVLMPWVEGATWQEVILSQQELSSERALGIARSLARVLMTMEERGLAHCDLSGPNLIVQPGDRVALVDLEEMYGPGFMQPEALPAGSPGYAHKSAPLGLWQAQADRFSGAVLLAEMLGWCDPKVRTTAWGESYFPPAEMQDDGERYETLHASLARMWGRRTANLFAQAWRSDSLLDCPTFAEWAVALPEGAPARMEEPERAPPAESAVGVALLVLSAETAADTGSWDQALALYRRALEAAPPELAGEITARIATVEAKRAAALAERPPTVVRPRKAETPAWDCPHCGRAVGVEREVCPYCELGQRDGTVIARRPVEPPPAQPAPPPVAAPQEPAPAYWNCANCGRAVPAARDLCPHCGRGRRDGTIVSTRPQVRAEPVTAAEPELAALLAAAPPRAAPMSLFARWSPVLMLGATWALGWCLGWHPAGRMLGLFDLVIVLLGDLIVGLGTGLILRWTERTLRGRHVLLLALGWPSATVCLSILSILIPGLPGEGSLAESSLAAVWAAIGGLITGVVLRKSGSLRQRRQLIWVVGGYAAAWWLASAVGRQLYTAVAGISGALARILMGAAFGAVAGAVGGGVLYWQLGRLTGRAVPAPAPPELRPPPAALPEPRKRRVPCLVWILAGIGALLICLLLANQFGILGSVFRAQWPAGPVEAPAAEPVEEPPEPTEEPALEQPTEVPEVELLTVSYPCDGHVLREIAAVDELTIRLSFCEPVLDDVATAVAQPILGIFPREWIEETEGTGEPVESVVGTGPYYLDSWDREEAIVLRRFDDYWGQPAVAEALIYRWATDDEYRLHALQAGDVDFVAFVSREHYETVQRDPNLQLLVVPGLNIMYLGMNNAFPPWDDVRVRQAIAVGIDRQRIVENYYPPGSEVASHYTPCAVPNGCAGEEWYPFDPELGRALLAEAGYSNGFQTSLYYADLEQFAPTYLPDPAGVAADLKAQLRHNLGVDAQVVPMDRTTFIDQMWFGLLDGLYLDGRPDVNYPDVTQYLDIYFGRGELRFGEPYPEIYEVLEEAAALPEQAAAHLYAQANNAIRELVPMVPVAHGACYAYAARADVEGALAPVLGAPRFWRMNPGGREELVYMGYREPPDLYETDRSEYARLDVSAMVNETLLAYDENGVAQPWLATDWEVNEDATVWTFYLRPGVRFHDGSALDANDVVKSWEVLYTYASGPPAEEP